jgi:hypothetical protein
MNAQTWGATSAAVVALLALVAAVYTARSARKGGDRSSDIADRAEFTASYSKLTQDLQGDRDAVRQQVADVVERMDAIERRYWGAVRYIRQLRTVVVHYLPADQVPAIPTELEQDV